MAPSIPDRWIPYKPCGKVIEGTRIICFKVPLKRSVQVNKRDITEIWDVKKLLQKIDKLIAVIDLTNTNKYYNPNELEAAGVLHKKILMPGRILPPENKVKEFMDAVDEFLGKNCDALVGVHCTHGLNRTGYMVCRYMRDRLGIPAKEAIKRFEIARGYQIERQNYINDILGKSVPEPDFGADTQVIKVDKKRDFSYKSPLDDCGYDDLQSGNKYSKLDSERNCRIQERDRTIRDSCRTQERNGEGCSRNSGSKSWRDQENGNHRSRKRTNSNSSYNYKFDY